MTPTDIGHGRGWLDAAAAASLRRIDAAIGRPLRINSAGRWAWQQAEAVAKYEAGGPYAAPVGTSPHEFGNAVDTDDRFIALMAEHGWTRPIPKTEPWHFVYNPANDKHRTGATPTGTGSLPYETTEDDMFTEADRKMVAEIRQAIFGKKEDGPNSWDGLAKVTGDIQKNVGEIHQAIYTKDDGTPNTWDGIDQKLTDIATTLDKMSGGAS